MIEHARWFPHCAYAKQLCGAKLYRKIQESTQTQQGFFSCSFLNVFRFYVFDLATPSSKNWINQLIINNSSTVDDRWSISDEDTLWQLVAARLDLPISQSLLSRNFNLSIIKRCWEDQLRLKHEDFVSDSDLLMACTILQKQIEYIDGNKEHIIIPIVTMRKNREREKAR
ncbi:unnamed protein product [Rotaria sp. Silwood1]|nr:unnamed protein product [Rotaria sp. Silwood1]